jgi:hypothetical protein
VVDGVIRQGFPNYLIGAAGSLPADEPTVRAVEGKAGAMGRDE